MEHSKAAYEPLLAADDKPEYPDATHAKSGSTAKSTSPSKSKFSIGVFAFLLIFVLPLVFYVESSGRFGNNSLAEVVGLSEDDAEELTGVCPSPDPLPVKAPKKNIWKNLNLTEATAIRKWLWDPERNFNLTKSSWANERDNAIFLIEAFAPKKGAALAYLNGDAEAPAKYAHAVIHHGNTEEIKDWLIGPLPLGPETKIRQLTEIYHQPDIPYNAGRHFLGNSSQMGAFMKATLAPLAEVTQDLFGAVATGMMNDTLIAGGTSPMSYDGTWRRVWMGFKLNIPGFYLHPVDLYMYMEMTGTDSANWKVLSVIYNHQVFNSVAEFKAAWASGTLIRSVSPENDGSGWSTRTRKGNKRDLDERAGPRQVSFNGPRMRIDRENDYFTWMGWSMYMGFERDMGLNLWDINFRGERIIYELSAQEAMAQYSGNDAHQSTTVFLDRAFGMGACVKELMVGYDCPSEALYLPATVHTAIGSSTRINGVCIFESQDTRPLSRHTGWGKDEAGAIKAYELTVRSISTVGNYDYFFDYKFQLDGTVEIRLSASGYLQGGVWDDQQSSYGHQIRQTSMGNLHDHMINYKIDFDIAGEENTMMAISLEQESIEQPWHQDDWGVNNQTVVRRRMITSEDESKLNYAANGDGMYVVVNQNKTNAWGNPRGYAIHPGASAVHLSNLHCKRTEKNVNWGKNNLAVTKHHDNELYSSSMWNIDLPGAPTVDFDRFFDGESIEQEDIVVWANLGTHHLPHAEDSPHTLTNTATSYILLTPWNYNDYDVSFESQNAIVLNPGTPGALWDTNEYEVKPEFCLPAKAKPFTYHGLVSYEEDGTLAKPLSIIETRKENEKIHAIWAE